MKKKEDFPKVKYKVVAGYGSFTCDTWEGVQGAIKRYQTDPVFKDKDDFKVKYVIKITEEYIEV